MSVQTDYYIPQMKLLDEQISKQASEITKLRAALQPFAEDKMPSLRRSEIGYDRHGLRRCISPMELAMFAAHKTLSRG